MEELPIEVEEAVQKSCFICEKIIKPAVVYDTFSKEAMTFPIEVEAPEKWIAVSPYIVTIGNVLEEEYNNNKALFGEYGVQIMSAISSDALDQSRNFVQKLLASEASDENCELSRSIELPKQYNRDIINYIPVEKINLSLNEEGNFIPASSMAGLYYWIPLKKRSRK